MQAKHAGTRYPLLYYRRSMGRLFFYTLILGIVMVAAGSLRLLNSVMILGIPSEVWLFAAGMLSLAISAFAFVAQNLAYVQPYASYLKVTTPFLRFKVSYQRIRSARPSLLQQIFPPERSSWSQRTFLEPFYGKTAVVVDTKGYPYNPRLLKLFLPAPMFSPRSAGFVLLVPDWISLCTELDSYLGAWQAGQGRQARGASLR
jgi:hypothetical protein